MRAAWRRSAVSVLVLTALFLAFAPAGFGRPTEDLEGSWLLKGKSPQRGAYTGQLEIAAAADGSMHLTSTLTFADTKTLGWSGTGKQDAGVLTFTATTVRGLVGALPGTDPAKGAVTGTYKLSKSGKKLKGEWSHDGVIFADTAERPADADLLTLVDGNGVDVPTAKKHGEGVVLAVDVRETDAAPFAMLPIKIAPPKSFPTADGFLFDFPTAKIAVWRSAKHLAGTEVKPGAIVPVDTKELYLEGLAPSAPGGAEILKVSLVAAGKVVAHDSGRVAVAQSAYLVLGHGNSGSYSLESYATAHKLDKRTSPVIVKGKTESGQPTCWAIYLLETQKGAALALSTPGAVVAYDGHSNFGLGFAFGVDGTSGFKSMHEFMLISDFQVAVNWEYLRDHQGHPNLMFAESEYGDDSTTPEFSDPVSVASTIKGSKSDYNNMRTARFPPNGGVGTRGHLKRGTARWQDTHPDISDGSRIIVKSGAPDMPEKRWSKLFLNSCYSGPYYYDSFGGHGTLYFTLEESSSPQTSAGFIEGCIEGKTDDQILAVLNGLENINDYHVFK